MLQGQDPLNVIITGVGGQGNVLSSQILGRVLMDKGFIVTIGETLGLSQRGGSVMSHVRASRSRPPSPLIPEGLGHLIVALEPVEGLRILGQYGNPKLLMLTNTRPIPPLDVLSGEAEYPGLDIIFRHMQALCRRVWSVAATDIALSLGNPILANIVMLGALAALEVLPLDRVSFEKALSGLLGLDRMAINLKAFERGQEAVQELESGPREH